MRAHCAIQATATAIVADERIAQEDVARGFAETSGSAPQGGEPDGHGVYHARMPQGVALLAFPRDCSAVTIVAAGRAEAERQARSVLAE